MSNDPFIGVRAAVYWAQQQLLNSQLVSALANNFSIPLHKPLAEALSMLGRLEPAEHNLLLSRYDGAYTALLAAQVQLTFTLQTAIADNGEDVDRFVVEDFCRALLLILDRFNIALGK